MKALSWVVIVFYMFVIAWSGLEAHINALQILCWIAFGMGFVGFIILNVFWVIDSITDRRPVDRTDRSCYNKGINTADKALADE